MLSAPAAVTSAGASVSRPLLADSAELAPTSPAIPGDQLCVDRDAADPRRPSRFPTSIASATVVPAAKSNPAYCDVKGMIAPQTHFELELPVSTWQGRYLQNGCGGYCGTSGTSAVPVLRRPVGWRFRDGHRRRGAHQRTRGSGVPGCSPSTTRCSADEYGYHSEHALAVVAKTIITDYYGTGPNHSYYDGCSDGGREAMAMAERYPDGLQRHHRRRPGDHRRPAERRAADLAIQGQHRRQWQRDPHQQQAGGAAHRGDQACAGMTAPVTGSSPTRGAASSTRRASNARPASTTPPV